MYKKRRPKKSSVVIVLLTLVAIGVGIRYFLPQYLKKDWVNFEVKNGPSKYEEVVLGDALVRLTRFYAIEGKVMDGTVFLEVGITNISDSPLSITEEIEIVVTQAGEEKTLIDERKEPAYEYAWKDQALAPEEQRYLIAWAEAESGLPIELTVRVRGATDGLTYTLFPDPAHRERYLARSASVNQLVMDLEGRFFLANTGYFKEGQAVMVVHIMDPEGMPIPASEGYNVRVRRSGEESAIDTVEPLEVKNQSALKAWFTQREVPFAKKSVVEVLRFAKAYDDLAEGEEIVLIIESKADPTQRIELPYTIEKTPFGTEGI